MLSVICNDIFTGFTTLLHWNEMYYDAITHLTEIKIHLKIRVGHKCGSI